MTYNHPLFESIRNRSWMVGLPERVKNVIAAYGEIIRMSLSVVFNELSDLTELNDRDTLFRAAVAATKNIPSLKGV